MQQTYIHPSYYVLKLVTFCPFIIFLQLTYKKEEKKAPTGPPFGKRELISGLGSSLYWNIRHHDPCMIRIYWTLNSCSSAFSFSHSVLSLSISRKLISRYPFLFLSFSSSDYLALSLYSLTLSPLSPHALLHYSCDRFSQCSFLSIISHTRRVRNMRLLYHLVSFCFFPLSTLPLSLSLSLCPRLNTSSIVSL